MDLLPCQKFVRASELFGRTKKKYSTASVAELRRAKRVTCKSAFLLLSIFEVEEKSGARIRTVIEGISKAGP